MHKMTLLSRKTPPCPLPAVLGALCPCESNPRLRGEETGDMFRPPPNCPVSSGHRVMLRGPVILNNICTSQPSPLGSRITNTEYRLSTSLPKSFQILILLNSLSDLKISSRPARLPFRHKDDVKFERGIFLLVKDFNF